MIRIGVRSFVSAGGGTDADAQAFITAAGITDATQQSAINTLVTDLKGYGVWSKMKAIYPFVGGTASTHKWNLKDPRDLNAAFRLVFSGGWTHSSTGALPNGTNGYADTFLNCLSNLSQNSTHFSFYSLTNSAAGVGTGKIDIGCQTLTTASMFMGISHYNNFEASFYQSNLNNIKDTNPTDTRGYMVATVQSSTSFKAFWKQAGGSFGQKGSTINTISGSLPNNNIYLAVNGSTSTKYEYSNRACAFASIGDGLTDTEAANLYTAVQAYQTSLNRNV